MRRICLSFLILFSMNVERITLNAQEAGTELDFMSLGAGARPAGVGGSFTSIADDANSVYWNQAGMCFVLRPELTYMHTDLYFGTTFDYISAVTPLSRSSFNVHRSTNNEERTTNNYIGFAVIRASTGDIPITAVDTTDTIPGTDYNRIIYEGIGGFKASTYSVSYARRFSDRFTVGIGVKLIDMELVNHSGTGYGMDASVLVKSAKLKSKGSDKSTLQSIFDNLSIGVSVQDVTVTRIKWSTETVDKIAPNLRFGLSYRILTKEEEGGWIPKEGIIFTAEADQQIKTERQGKWHKAKYHLGAEWKLVSLVPIRVGWDDDNFTSGIGFITEHINVDYAYVSHQELKTTHRVSVTLKM